MCFMFFKCVLHTLLNCIIPIRPLVLHTLLLYTKHCKVNWFIGLNNPMFLVATMLFVLASHNKKKMNSLFIKTSAF